jgi:hypothetical protein
MPARQVKSPVSILGNFLHRRFTRRRELWASGTGKEIGLYSRKLMLMIKA